MEIGFGRTPWHTKFGGPKVERQQIPTKKAGCDQQHILPPVGQQGRAGEKGKDFFSWVYRFDEAKLRINCLPIAPDHDLNPFCSPVLELSFANILLWRLPYGFPEGPVEGRLAVESAVVGQRQ